MAALNIGDLNNAKQDIDHIAEVANSEGLTATDRAGHVKPTVKGAIDSLKAFNIRGAFAAGAAYKRKDVYTDNGIAYVAVEDHVATTVVADVAAGRVTVHQGATREELAAPDGASKVGFKALGAEAQPRNLDKKLQEWIGPEDYFLAAESTSTGMLQRALNAAASFGVELVSSAKEYIVTGLVIPSNLRWRGNNTVVKLAAASNVPALANAHPTFKPADRVDSNIRITGLIIDGNGNAQNDALVDGTPVVGVRMHGVKNLHLDVTVRNARRYAYWLLNVSHVRGEVVAEWTPDYVWTPNRDGMHINGNSDDIYFTTIKVIGAGDDAVAINADDVAHGGAWSQAAVSGPISNVTIDVVIAERSDNGVRLLSANYEIADVTIRKLLGDVTLYGLEVQDYGLGTNSSYRNIRIENLSMSYRDSTDAARANTALVRINVANPQQGSQSDFWFGNIDRGQTGVEEVSRNRDTLKMVLRSATVRVDRIVERFCSNQVTARLSGDPVSGAAGPGVEFTLGVLHKKSSVAATNGFYGAAVYVTGAKNVDRVEIGFINADFLRHSLLVNDSTVTNCEVWKPNGTQAEAVYISGGSTLENLLVRGIPSTMLSSAPFFVDGTSQVKGVGSSIDTGPWKAPALTNGWTSYGAPYANAAYRKTADGMVELCAVVTGGVIGQPIFTLPVGFRPNAARIFAAVSNDAIGQIRIFADGRVVPVAPSVAASVSLDGITFRAEQ